ncbi:hypothetical protein BGW38_007105 [Lunasporangiospora selenospora]|uniref:Uncharacterized protein n=1 Tax=Lunasporangiospora selenospora TaxID=979761 RepID=A0A9P6KG21_9FUNG|nr:hypothetical protein BGW38_007105 [Lunasporangiospora selenospora]
MPALYDTFPVWRATGAIRIIEPTSDDYYRVALFKNARKHNKLSRATCRCSVENEKDCVMKIIRRSSRFTRSLILLDPSIFLESQMLKLQYETCITDRSRAAIQTRRRAAKGRRLLPDETSPDVKNIFCRLRHLALEPMYYLYSDDLVKKAPQVVDQFMIIAEDSRATLESLSENWADISWEHHCRFASLFMEWLSSSFSSATLSSSLDILNNTQASVGIQLKELRLTSWVIELATLNWIIEACPRLETLSLDRTCILPSNETPSRRSPTPIVPFAPSFVLNTRGITSLSLTKAELPTHHPIEFNCPLVREMTIEIRTQATIDRDLENVSASRAISTWFVWTLPRIEKIKYIARGWDPNGIFGTSMIDYPATAFGWSRDVRNVKVASYLSKYRKNQPTPKTKRRNLEEWPTDSLTTLVFIGAGLRKRQVARLTFPANRLVNLNLSWDTQLDGEGIIRILTKCPHLRRLIIASVFLWLDEHTKALETPWACQGLEELSILTSISRRHARPSINQWPYQFESHSKTNHIRKPEPVDSQVSTLAEPIAKTLPSRQKIKGGPSYKKVTIDQEELLREQAIQVASFLNKYQKQPKPKLETCFDHPVVSVFYKRISELTKLKELNLGEGYNTVWVCCGVPLTLQSGLGQLKTLTEMKIIHVTSWTEMMGAPEADWMAEHWPLLEKVVLREKELASFPQSQAFRKAFDRSSLIFQADICYRSDYKSLPDDELYFSSDRSKIK